MTGPIFVTGVSRSGKTLMRGLLSSHSRLIVSRRTDLWPRFFARFGDLGLDANFRRCLDAMLRRPQIAALGTDVDRLVRDFRSGARTYPRLFALMHEQYAERWGKARWGDQTNGLDAMTSEIVPAYRGVRILHMVRDPRDRHVALSEKRSLRAFSVERSTRHWTRSARLALRNTRRYPENYRAVTYEALVLDSDRTMREVCAFLGETFESNMFRMESESRYDAERQASGNASPLTSAFVGCHRDALDGWTRRFVAVAAHREMRALGYTVVPARLRLESST
jgi:hypothetical protein